MRIGFVTDVHFREAITGEPHPKREFWRMRATLEQCFQAYLDAGAELVICAGDDIDAPEGHPQTEADLVAFRDLFTASGLPHIIIPGNHDPELETFYRVIPRPPRVLRLGDCEFITFYDDVVPPGQVRAVRPEHVLAELRDLLSHNPPGISHTFLIQHYVIYPEYSGKGYPHTYQNDHAIREIIEQSPRRILSLSGHRHYGYPLIRHNGVTSFTGCALCERPYIYYILHAEPQTVTVQELSVV